MQPGARVRVVLADDDPRFRAAALASLQSGTEVEVVAVLGDGSDVIRALQEHRATVLVMDLGMPGSGTGLVRAAREAVPGLGVTVMTAQDDVQTCVELLRAGTRCIISKYTIDDDLSRCAVRCHHGDVVLIGQGPAAAIDVLLGG